MMLSSSKLCRPDGAGRKSINEFRKASLSIQELVALVYLRFQHQIALKTSTINRWQLTF